MNYMKQRIIIALAVILLIAAGFFMASDFYKTRYSSSENPYEYEIDQFRNAGDKEVCYQEIIHFNTDVHKAKALAVDRKNHIYVGGDEQVKIFGPFGELKMEFSINEGISCMCTTKNGILYLGISDHVEVWSDRGNLIKQWPAYNNRSLLTSIAVGKYGVFVADAGNKKVLHYDLEGQLRNEFGSKNKTKGVPGFIIPSPYFDLLIGREDEVWVVNPGRHSLESYDEKGNFLFSWKRTSMTNDGFSGCCNPSHIAMLEDGSFVTSEKGIERVKIHKPDGDFKCIVASSRNFDHGTTGIDIAVDRENRIVLLDPSRDQVRIFEEKEENHAE